MKNQSAKNVMSVSKTVLSLFAIAIIVGCGKSPKNDDSASGTASTQTTELEATLNAINGIANDSSSSSGSVSKPESQMQEAALSLCGRVAAVQPCQADQPVAGQGLKQASFSGCLIPYTAITATGQVNLTYNTNSCSLSSASNSVVRTYNMTYGIPGGFSVNANSDSNTDYRGSTYGGGGELDKTASGWNLSILGRHVSVKNATGLELVSMSMRTTSPLQITGSLSQSNRVINSGSLEVNHNKLEYTKTYSASNLTWNSSQCCHPVAGSFSVTYSGKRTGSGTVTFNGCGSAQEVDETGSVTSLTLSACE